MWNFKTKKDDLIYIENTSKTKVLENTNGTGCSTTWSDQQRIACYQVSLEDFEEEKAEQLWRRGEPDAEGYFILESSLVYKYQFEREKVITAMSESVLAIKGNITEIPNTR